MKRAAIKTLCLLLTCSMLFCSSACIDLGVGEDENSFKEYFSSVFLLSRSGMMQKKVAIFNRNIDLETMGIETVVEPDKYSYICFKVANGHELTIDEFSFFAKTDGDVGILELEFYISDVIPTKLKNSDDEEEDYTYLPDEEETGDDNSIYEPELDDEGNEVEREDEVEEDVFESANSYCKTSFPINDKWNSVHLVFEQPETISEYWYVVIRVVNNSYLDSDDQLPPISFTFNYILFRFSDVKKH